jgi:transcription elongation factor Elf1
MRNSYVHEAAEPDYDMPAILCSFCNEQKLVVFSNIETGRIFYMCNDCDYEWEFDTKTMEWCGYSLEGDGLG